MRLAFLLIMVLFLAACMQKPVAISALSVKQLSHYTVRQGDSLQSIAQGFSLSEENLVAWNHLSQPYQVHAGQVLSLRPGAAAATLAKLPVATVAPKHQQVAQHKPVVTAPSHDQVIKQQQKWRVVKRPQFNDQSQQASKPEAQADTKPTPKPKPTPTPTPTPKQAPKTNLSPISCNKVSAQGWHWPSCGGFIQNNIHGQKSIVIEGKLGQNVLASAPGKVVYAGSGVPGYGKMVMIRHSNGMLSVYGDNQSLLVKTGQTVKAAQKIATMGQYKGDQAGLLFEVRQKGKTLNPISYLAG